MANADETDTTGQRETVRIGVLANRGEQRCLEMWRPTAEYLSRQIEERRFEIVPLDFHGIYEAVGQGKVDFFIVNSSLYVDLEFRCGASRIATLKNMALPQD